MLKELLKSKNEIPQYLKECDTTSIPMSKINDTNWMMLSNEYRRSFMLESQFRTYYTDYFLSALDDRKTIYKECHCYKNYTTLSLVDNVIYIADRYLSVEIKFSVPVQKNINAQVQKYCNDEKIIIDSKKGREILSEKSI